MTDRFRVIAIMSAFNEGDIISSVIRHLVENDVEVYLLDDDSTDDTVEQARQWLGRGLIGIETFPSAAGERNAAGHMFQWARILERKEALAQTLTADWFIHHDADEIREGPWPGFTLKEAIRWVDTLGYNAIDFRVLNFPPVDDRFRPGDNPRTHFTLYEEGEEFNAIQLKCWKRTAAPPSLVPFGGHEVQFAGRRIFPIRFLLRHYPIRGQAHGMKKVFAERKGRFLESELAMGWHLQYNRFGDDAHSFLRDPATLIPFDRDRIRLEQMLPDTNLRTLAKQVLREDEALDRLRIENGELRRHAATLERDRDSLRQHATVLENDRASLTKHAAVLQQDRESLTEHAANLTKDRDSLRQHATNLEDELASLKRHVEHLENEFRARPSLRAMTESGE